VFYNDTDVTPEGYNPREIEIFTEEQKPTILIKSNDEKENYIVMEFDENGLFEPVISRLICGYDYTGAYSREIVVKVRDKKSGELMDYWLSIYYGKFREYGGVYLSLDSYFRTRAGQIIAEDISRRGGKISSILDRGSGIINVNYLSPATSEGHMENRWRNYRIRDNKITCIGEGTGVYTSSFTKASGNTNIYYPD
jgi:hypothetical protein